MNTIYSHVDMMLGAFMFFFMSLFIFFVLFHACFFEDKDK